jgi:hypothetical protein
MQIYRMKLTYQKINIYKLAITYPVKQNQNNL